MILWKCLQSCKTISECYFEQISFAILISSLMLTWQPTFNQLLWVSMGTRRVSKEWESKERCWFTTYRVENETKAKGNEARGSYSMTSWFVRVIIKYSVRDKIAFNRIRFRVRLVNDFLATFRTETRGLSDRHIY